MKSVSGIRGIVGETLTPQLIARVGVCFAEWTGRGTVVVGRDSRPTGPAVEQGIVSALALGGANVILAGMVPTPTVQLLVEELKADGGIVISASHNPIQWNAFKLVGPRGTFLTADETAAFFERMEREPALAAWDGVGAISGYERAAAMHIDRVLRVIDVEAIRRRRYTVALDSVNGAGSFITRDLLERLGCRVSAIHCDPSKPFPRGAEPVPENLGDLAGLVVREKADIGFAQDPDADRLAVVDETGRPIGEERTVTLVTEHFLSRRTGRVVINLSTTRAVDDIAKKYGAPLVRTAVGEINVVEEMISGGALIGGEGNGGVIAPEIHLGRDSLAGIAYILEMMALRGETVGALDKSLPAYHMIKGKVTVEGLDDVRAVADIQTQYGAESLSTIDGLRIEFTGSGPFQGGWVHLRKSNTEPIFRIITEGRDRDQAEAIYRHFAAFFTS